MWCHEFIEECTFEVPQPPPDFAPIHEVQVIVEDLWLSLGEIEEVRLYYGPHGECQVGAEGCLPRRVEWSIWREIAAMQGLIGCHVSI